MTTQAPYYLPTGPNNEYTYKKVLGVAYEIPNTPYYSETVSSLPFIFNNQIMSNNVPSSAPDIIEPAIATYSPYGSKYQTTNSNIYFYQYLPLEKNVDNNGYSYVYSTTLTDNLTTQAIPSTYDSSNASYTINLYYVATSSSSYSQITLNNSNYPWIFDTATGCLTFIGNPFTNLGSYSPPLISFYRYEGDFGININNVSGNLSVSGDLDVSGNTFLYGSLDVSGSSTFNDFVTINNGLDVSGNTFLYGNLDVSLNTIIYGNLDVCGTLYATSVQYDTAIYSYLTVENVLDVCGNANFYSNVDVSGNVDISGNLTVIGNIIGTLTFADLTTAGYLDVSGTSSLYGNVAIGSSVSSSNPYALDVSGTTFIGGALDVSGTTFIVSNGYTAPVFHSFLTPNTTLHNLSSGAPVLCCAVSGNGQYQLVCFSNSSSPSSPSTSIYLSTDYGTSWNNISNNTNPSTYTMYANPYVRTIGISYTGQYITIPDGSGSYCWVSSNYGSSFTLTYYGLNTSFNASYASSVMSSTGQYQFVYNVSNSNKNACLYDANYGSNSFQNGYNIQNYPYAAMSGDASYVMFCGISNKDTVLFEFEQISGSYAYYNENNNYYPNNLSGNTYLSAAMSYDGNYASVTDNSGNVWSTTSGFSTTPWSQIGLSDVSYNNICMTSDGQTQIVSSNHTNGLITLTFNTATNAFDSSINSYTYLDSFGSLATASSGLPFISAGNTNYNIYSSYNSILDVSGNGYFQELAVQGTTVLNGPIYQNLDSNNTSFGYQALVNNTTGLLNTAFGYQALVNNTTGSYNTGIGYDADCSGYSYSTALGYNAVCTSNNQIMLGTDAETVVIPGDLDVCGNLTFSSGALDSLTVNGQSNLNGLVYQTLPNYGTAFGYQALQSNDNSFNSAFGYNALYTNSSGIENTAVGYAGLNQNNTGSSNTAIGCQALESNTSGYGNTAVGYVALPFNIDGSYNTAVGNGAGLYTTGSHNVCLGQGADISGSAIYSTAIGNSSYCHEHSYSTALGYNAVCTSNNQIMLGTAAETVVVPGDLDVCGNIFNMYGAITTTGTITSNASDTAISAPNGSITAVSLTTTSDYRIKSDIQPLNDSFTIDDLNPVSFYNERSKKKDLGLIAHELQALYPDLVTGEKDGEEYQSISYISLIPILIKEVKDLKKSKNDLKDLKNDLKESKNEINDLKNELNDLKNELKDLKQFLKNY